MFNGPGSIPTHWRFYVRGKTPYPDSIVSGSATIRSVQPAGQNPYPLAVLPREGKNPYPDSIAGRLCYYPHC